MKTEKSSESKDKDNAKRKSAKKDLRFQYKGKLYDLKKGDDCSKIPKELHENLKTEGVL